MNRIAFPILLLLTVSRILGQIPQQNLQLWLKADQVVETGGKVQQWTDLSPNNYSIVQNTPANQPQKINGVLNGRPVIRFNGSTTYLDGGDILDLGTNNHTIFLVGLRNSANGTFIAKSIAAGVSGRYALFFESNLFTFLYQDNTTRNITTNQWQTGRFYLLCAENSRNEAKNKLILNEQTIGESSISDYYDFNTSYNFLIGAYNNSSGSVPPLLYLNGDIAEIIIYSRLLSSSEKNAVSLYLDSKYSPAFSLGNDTVIPYGFNYRLEVPSAFTDVQWSTGAASQSIVVSNSGQYWVTAISPLGVRRYDTIQVTIPTPQINYSQTNLCSDSVYEFHVGEFRSGNHYTLSWFNGYTGDTLRITNYQGAIWAKVTDSAGYFSYTDTLHVFLDNFTHQFSLGTDTTLCGGSSFSIAENPYFSQLTQWVWSNGSNQTSIPIVAPGNYSITVTNTNSCTAIDTISVNIQGTAPVADFSINGHCQNSTIEFFNQSVPMPGDPIASVQWNFGDGTISEETNPMHIYTNAGDYLVQMVVYTESGCSNRKEQLISINPQPTAFFRVDKACTASPYLFFDQSVPADGTHLVSYLWDFGTGDSSMDSNPIYQFMNTGTFQVTLTVTDNRGCSNTYSQTIEVVSSLPPAQQPSLISPAPGFPTDSLTIAFRWNTTQGALYYRLQIAGNSNFNPIIHNIITPNYQKTVNLPAGKYFWRVLAYNGCEEATASETREMLTGFPQQLSGLQLHYSVFEGLDTVNQKVVSWQNLANPSQWAIQSNALFQPVFVSDVLNGRPSVMFGNAGATYLEFNPLTVPNQDFSVVMVYKPLAFDLPVHYIASGGTATTSEGGIFAGGSLIAGPGVFDGQNTLRLSENYSGWQIVVIRSNDILINTLHPALASSATAQQLKLNLLGSRTNALNSQFFKGFLSEFMVFNRRITEEEALALTHYLRYKFFPPLSLGNDTSLVCGSCNYPIVAPSGYLEYQWSNGSTLPQTVAQQTGTYTLTVTDAFNLMSSDDIRVVCPSQSCYPSVNLGPDLYGTCGFCNFTISASAPHFVNYLWSTGATTPTIVVTSTGYYSVTATDIDGYLSVDTIFVQCPTVSCDPPVNLGSDISVTYGFCPVTIQANTIYNQYLWSTGSTQSSITVNNPGTYWVRVVDQYNFISSDTIKVLYPTIQLRDTAFCSGQSVILNPNLGNGYTYLWSTTSMNPTIQVNQPGDFWVMVFDSLGCSRKSQTIRVSEDTLPLMQWFSSYDTTLCRNSQLSVINIPNYSYSWNTSETGNSITVENGGLYRLTVTSPYGCTSTDSVFVHINGQAPIVIFGVNDGCTNTPLTVINETVSIDQVPITRWEWRINQQLVDTVQYPILTINQPGTHEITLTAGNQNGCVATQSKTVTVYPTPNIQLIAPEIACTQMPVHFSADVSPASSSISYLWTVQGQFFSNEPSPFLIFDSAGFFTVSLTVTTPEACYSTAEKTIQVIDINPESQTITLTSPQANEIINSGRVMFHWQAIGSFLNFTLQISNDPSFNSILFEAETTQTSLSVTLPPYHILYWRVVGTNLCHSLVYSTSQALQKFSPQSLNSLALWLSADSVLISHGKVVQWYDLSPNHFLIQQPTATNQPQKVENGLNGRPVIRFNGTNTYLDGGDILDLGTNSHTVFLIGSRNSANGVFFAKSLSGAVSGRYALLHETNNFYFLYQDNISREIYTNQFQIGRFYLIQAINNRDDAKNQLLLNSELIGEKNINEFYEFNTDYRFLIGAYNNSTGGLPPNSNLYLNGDIAEIIIYNRLLTEQESDQIKQYLALKYGLAVNLGDDIFAQSFCPVTLEIPGDFTNVLWSTGSTEHTTTVSESGVYWVEATNTFGIITRDTIEVRFPTIDIPDEVYFCLGSSTTVEPHLEGNYTYLWSNGMTTPSIQISTPGNYWVRVTDSLGCWKEHYFRAKADSFALQASLGDDGPICNGTRVSLVSGSENAVAYLWSNGSNLPYFTINNHTQVSVTVTNNNGCQAIDTINLSIIGDAPLLAFDHGALCKANQFAFTDHSQSLDGSAIATRRWIFNHTDTLYGSQVSYSYPDTGKIQIQLKVSTESGCWNDTSFNRRVNDIPMVNFSPTTVCERNSVQFTSFGTLSDGTITGYHWDFPESTLTTANPVYSFSTAGQQTVSLTLTSNHGCSNSITKTVEIKNSPVADFTWSTACEGLPVRFTNTTQTWLSTLSDYFWTFNQQVNFTQTHPQYTFPTAGNYVVQLVAIQRVNQCRDTILKTVTVAPNPTALPFPASGCATETIALHHASIPGIGYSLNQVEWNVAPVAGIISGNHLISNNTAGTFPIEITVTNNAGCSASAQSTVQIFEKPDAHIVIPNDTLYLPVNFIVSSLNNNAEYLYRWYRNGTLTSTDSSWRFIQNMAQIDTLALEMRTPHGCFDSDRMVITTLVPEIDLEMISMSATIFNNQLLIRVQIRNNGTVPINNTLLKITSDKFNSISELCTETVSPGQILPYTLRTRILINENELPRYICVETETNGDNLIENNSQCFFFDTQLRIFNPTPNPARDFVDVKIISPSSAWAEFTFINSMGAILDQKSHAIEEGLNNIRLSLPKSATGVIVLKIKIVDNSHFYKILVNQ